MADSTRTTEPAAAETPVKAPKSPLADPMIYLVVFLGGCLGTGMRYGLSLEAGGHGATGVLSAIHIGTFTANILACLVYAALSAYLGKAVWIRKRSRDLVSRGFGMGMCGGLSTMSTLAFEQLAALQSGNVLGVVAYVLVSFGCGVLAAYLGVRLALALAGVRSRGHAGKGGAGGPARPAPDATPTVPAVDGPTFATAKEDRR